MSIYQRHNINIIGSGEKTLIFAHGFGCDQNMWRLVAPAFQHDCRVVLFDYVGFGKSDVKQYDSKKYSTLQGYADDVLEIAQAVADTPVVFVGHSVSSMIGVIAAIQRPERFESLILVGPSPCYINDGDYVGGFSREDIGGLLDTLQSNYLGWSSTMAPVIMGNPERPELAAELAESFCRTNPDIAREFARVTFLSDNRADLPLLKMPVLILQCSEDVIAPECVGQFTYQQIAGSSFVQLRATGHCPQLSAPEEMVRAMRAFLGIR
jgi:sigma-B regulation protein RsbQ